MMTGNFGAPAKQNWVSSDSAVQVLTFTLAHELYGIGIEAVREIRHYQTPTRIANTPDFVKGVVHLHGAIVPVVDLRVRFQSGAAIYDDFTVMIVLQLQERMVAMVVDSVQEVLDVAHESIEPVPDMKSIIHSASFTGLAKLPDSMLILVDAAKLVTEVDDWIDAGIELEAG